MEKIVEIGMLLDGDADYYDEILTKNGLKMVFTCETHDIYYTKFSYDELSQMTENQIKNSCIRIRDCKGLSNGEIGVTDILSGKNSNSEKDLKQFIQFENISLYIDEINKLEDEKEKVKLKNSFDKKYGKSYNAQKDTLPIQKEKLKEIIEILEDLGFYLIFDTFKVDYQYSNEQMKSRVQLQEIDNIGLLLYYDNPDYYQMPEPLQRKSLIDEVNGYGFNFSYDEMGIDKLRTLLLGYTAESYNQNG